MQEVLLGMVQADGQMFVKYPHFIGGKFQDYESERFGLYHARFGENTQIFLYRSIKFIEAGSVSLIYKFDGLVHTFAFGTGFEDNFLGRT